MYKKHKSKKAPRKGSFLYIYFQFIFYLALVLLDAL
jgi:hypothetical protein